LILFFLCFFISCKKDESNPIIGKWEGISERTIDYENSETVNDSTYTYETDEFVLEILEGGTCKYY
jgi:hypothetical protein